MSEREIQSTLFHEFDRLIQRQIEEKMLEKGRDDGARRIDGE